MNAFPLPGGIGISHLCDKARVLVLDEYHAVRGFYDSNNLEPRQ